MGPRNSGGRDAKLRAVQLREEVENEVLCCVVVTVVGSSFTKSLVNEPISLFISTLLKLKVASYDFLHDRD